MKHSSGKAYAFLLASPSLSFIAYKSETESLAFIVLIAACWMLAHSYSKLKLALKIGSFRNIFIFDAVSINSIGFLIEFYRSNNEYVSAVMFFGFIPWVIMTSLWKANSNGYKQGMKILDE